MSLVGYYELMFNMTQVEDSSLTWTELENMLPFERDIIVGLQQRYIEQRKQELES